MVKLTSWMLGLAIVSSLLAESVQAVDIYKLPKGSPTLKSAGPLTFGPYGLLFIGDNKAGTIVAVETGDQTGHPADVTLNIEQLSSRIAQVVGGDAATLVVNDLAVNPASGNVYLAVTSAGRPAIVRITGSGEIEEFALKDVGFSQATLPNAPADAVVGEGRRARNNRMQAITDLAFVDGQLIVSGLSSAKASSNVRVLAFPFNEVNEGANLEIFHAAHAAVENHAPIRTFVPFVIDGKPSLLAGFVCTPLVRFDLSAVESAGQIKGTTLAELGNRNQPLDMIVYKQEGTDYLLLANSARGVMKISTANVASQGGLTSPVSGGGTAGLPFEAVPALSGTVQLDKLDDRRAVVIVKGADSTLALRTVDLP